MDLAAFEALRDDRLEAAQAAFSEMLSLDDEDAFAAMWLGMIAVRRGNLTLAEGAFTHAVASVEQRMMAQDENEAFAVAAKRAQLELSLRRVQERMTPRQRALDSEAVSSAAADGGGGGGGGPRCLLNVTPIRRVHYREMGQAEFEEQHAAARRPVIIEGFGSLARDGAPRWSLEHLRATCGHLRPPLARFSASSASWAGMFKGRPPASFAAYADGIKASGEERAPGGGEGMVFDWALRHKGEGEGCAALLDELQVPSFFSNTIVSGYGPSLFVQANGTRCGLHFDKGGTHFWQCARPQPQCLASLTSLASHCRLRSCVALLCRPSLPPPSATPPCHTRRA